MITDALLYLKMENGDKNVDSLREMVSRNKANRRCAECGERMPSYVCLNFNTFVCTTCSGILREFNFRVKGISVSSFTAEEMSAIKNGGNANAANVFLAKLGKHSKKPAPGERDQIRQFVKRKYILKTWVDNGELSSQHQ